MYSNNISRKSDLKEEIYLVRVGVSDRIQRSWEIESRIKDIKDSLYHAVNGYTSLQMDHLFRNRVFNVVADYTFSGIITELIYPTRSVMPESFLVDLLDRYPKQYPDKKEFGKERGYMIQHLSENGWNPSLAMEKFISTQFLYMGRDEYYIATLPSFLLKIWTHYCEKNNIPNDDRAPNGTYPNGTQKFDAYCKWAEEFRRNNPEYTLEFWESQQETNQSWTSIR